MRGTGKNLDEVVGFSSEKKAEGTGGLVLSSHDRNGGGYKRMNGAGKG